MRFRFFRRRSFAANNRRMAIRHHWPWPVRLLVLFLVLACGLSAALVFYEFHRSAWGVEAQLRSQILHLQRQLAQSQSNVSPGEARQRYGLSLHRSDPLALANETTIELLSQQIKELEAENQGLKDDLGFYEYLLPVDGSGSVAIRNFQAALANPAGPGELQWQLLVMQPRRDAATFRGGLRILLKGARNGQDWQAEWPEKGQKLLEFSRYQRLEGRIAVPDNVTVTSLTAQVLNGRAVLSSQGVAIDDVP